MLRWEKLLLSFMVGCLVLFCGITVEAAPKPVKYRVNSPKPEPPKGVVAVPSLMRQAK